MAVREIEKLFANDSESGADLLGPWMGAARVDSAPTLTADVNLLLGENTRYGRRLRKQLSRAGMDAGSVTRVEAFLRKAMTTGRVKMADVRRSIDVLGNHPAYVLDQLATLAHLPKSDQPVLRMTGEHLFSQVQPYLVAGFLKATDAWAAFFDHLAKNTTHATAEALIRSGPRFHADLKMHAARLGTQIPRLEVDVVRLDAAAASMLAANHVLLSPELRAFLQKAIEAGARGELLVQALQELNSATSLGEAFDRHGVDVASLTVPDIQYNKSTLEVAIRTGWSFHAAVITSGAKLDKFIDDCLAAGLTASQSVEWAQARVFEGSERFRNFPDAVKEKLPRLQFDVATIVAEWKTRYAAEWTPTTEKFVTEALKKSLENDEFPVGRVRSRPGGPDRVWGGFGELLRLLAQYSKLPLPSEGAGN